MCFGAALLLLLGALLASWMRDVPIFMFLVDPAALTNAHPLIGVISNLGILVWMASVTVCLFTFALLQRRPAGGIPRGFFLYFGGLTALLLADDLFMIHERLAPTYLSADEKHMAGLYGLLVLGGLVRFRHFIRATPYSYFALALVLFIGSTIIDQIWTGWEAVPLFAEDGLKFLGITCWMVYFCVTCFSTLSAARHRESTDKRVRSLASSPPAYQP